MEARTVAQFRILEKIGEGGMGAVYKAEDTRLGRTVALKFLRPESLEDQKLRDRFVREARAIAALDHPHICTIYEIGEAGGGLFLAMAYIDGPPISALLASGPLSIERATGIAIQIAEGLEEAHRKGVIHRDIKPSNILLTGRGEVKIVDFGLASLFGEARLTGQGMAMGTPAYMAPEQWQGLAPDPRSDIWSLGVVLHEMLTGGLPFRGAEGRALSYSILQEAPRSMRAIRPEIAPELELLVEAMLAKQADQRVATAGQVAARLRACKNASGGDRRWDRTATMISVPAAVSVPVPLAPQPEAATIAVLPFVNMASDPENEYFADGVSEELITGLAKVGQLRVVSRTSAFRFKGSNAGPQEIGRQLNVKYLLTGSVRRAGDRLRMTAELVGTADGFQLWSEVYQREVRDVFAIQEELAGAILAKLRIQLTSANPLAQPRKKTESIAAYQLYLKGLFHWNKRTGPGMRNAIDFFQEAIDTDPLYPPPYCGLADSLMLSPLFGWDEPRNTMLRAKQAALRALEIDPTHAEAHVSLAMVHFFYDWDRDRAAAEFRTGLRLNPGYAIGRAFHAHFLLWTGRYELAMNEFRNALELDPLSLNMLANYGWFLVYQRRYPEAVEALKRALDMDADYVRANLYLGTALAVLGRVGEAVAATKKAVERSPEDPILLLWLSRVYALNGLADEARAALREVEALSGERHISPIDLAIAHGALKDPDRAVAWMERAVEERWPVPLYLRDPRFDPFREHPRFRDLMNRAGLSLAI